MHMLHAGHGTLALWDAAGGLFTRAFTVGLSSERTGSTFPAAITRSGQVVQTGTSFSSDDFAQERLPTWVDAASYASLGPYIIVPVRSEQAIIGTLAMGRLRGSGHRPFTEAEVRLAEGIAEVGGTAVRRARLFEQLERRLQEAQALRDIDMAISSSLDLRVTLNVLLDKVTSRLEVDAADVLLLDPHAQTLTFAAGRGFRTTALRHADLRLGEGYAGRAVFDGRAVSVSNLAGDPQFAGSALGTLEGFVAYYAVPLVAKGHVLGVLELFDRDALAPSQEWRDFLETLAGQAAIAIDSAALFTDLQRSNMDLALAYDTTLEGWSRALDLRDKETEGHTQRVTDLTLRLARAMGVSEAELVPIRRGALLHDIGKMGIPDSILFKHGTLSPDEWEVMQRHPVYAYELLSPIAYLRSALDIPYGHHEKWDGTGYPRGLKGEQIPLAARLFAAVDVWDGLRSDRPYRPAWSVERARAYIQEHAGSHFDPQVVELFLKMERELREDRQ
jgi:putative nucleotidyltransferase with HDIG domain